MTRPPIELHHSALELFLCPWRLQQIKVRGIEEPETFYTLVGTKGHVIACVYGKLCYKYRKQTDLDAFEPIVQQVLATVDPELHEDIRDVVGGLDRRGGFLPKFKLNKGSEYVFEQRMAINRDYEPCSPVCECCGGDGIEIMPDIAKTPITCRVCNGTGLPPYDIVAFTADRVEIKEGGRHVEITDYKMGFKRFDYDEAIYNAQLLLYAALWFWTHPECEEVVVQIWAPRFNDSSSHAYTRETALPPARERIEAGFTAIEILYDLYGDNDWPAECGSDNRRFCGLSGSCPKVAQMVANLRRAA